MKTIQELFEAGTVLLGDFCAAQLESRLLICKSASITEEEFYSERKKKLTRKQEQEFFKLIDKRKTGTPLAYLTNTREFWSLPFDVYPGVLIPRPETEMIVEKVIELSSRNEEVIVDIGTGCGNIGIALAKELPDSRVIASDVSRNAIRVARSNASRIGISNIDFIQGSLFLPLERLKLKKKCDFIVSNPPYIAEKEWKTLDSEIRIHEPKKALVAGETGLEIIRELVKSADKFLKPGGYLVFEIGYGQRKQVLQMFGKRWNRLRSYKDLFGIPRVITARKKM